MTVAGSRQRRDFLVEVAWLFHEEGLDQRAIAERFAVDRSTVSRALSEAQRLGIVQVTVTEPRPADRELAARLTEQYAITAHVAFRIGGESSMHAAAHQAARLLEQIAAVGHLTIAASWGRTLALAANLVRPRPAPDIVIVDAIGHARGERMVPAIDVTNALADRFGTTVVHLGAPAFAGSRSVLERLRTSPPVDRVLRQARAADVTLISVGVMGEASLLRTEGLLTRAAMHDLEVRGAVGEMLGYYLNAAGAAIEEPSLLPVGLSLDDLRNGRRIVAAAGGAAKAASIRAAIAGGIVDEIVVDDELANALLKTEDGPASAGRGGTVRGLTAVEPGGRA
jgi:deoxyribonucleoside regulator